MIKGQKNESPKRQARWGVRPGLCRGTGGGGSAHSGKLGVLTGLCRSLGEEGWAQGEMEQGEEGEGILAELRGQEGKRPEGGWTGQGRGRERTPGRWAVPGQEAFRWIFQRISSGGRGELSLSFL